MFWSALFSARRSANSGSIRTEAINSACIRLMPDAAAVVPPGASQPRMRRARSDARWRPRRPCGPAAPTARATCCLHCGRFCHPPAATWWHVPPPGAMPQDPPSPLPPAPAQLALPPRRRVLAAARPPPFRSPEVASWWPPLASQPPAAHMSTVPASDRGAGSEFAESPTATAEPVPPEAEASARGRFVPPAFL
jgi:hypothetical protein